jgi:thioredoxin-related protein
MNKLIYFFVVVLLTACNQQPEVSQTTEQKNETLKAEVTQHSNQSTQSLPPESEDIEDHDDSHHVPGLWITDMDEAQQRAKKENKEILIFFTGTDWCSSCNLLVNEVFKKQKAQDYIKKHFIMVELDFPSDSSILSEEQQAHNAKWGEKFEVDGYPVAMLTTADVRPYSAIVGYLVDGVDEYIESLEIARTAKQNHFDNLKNLEGLKGEARAKTLDELLSREYAYFSNRENMTQELMSLLPKDSDLYQKYDKEQEYYALANTIEEIPLLPMDESLSYEQHSKIIAERFKAFREEQTNLSHNLLLVTLLNETTFIEASQEYQPIIEIVDEYLLSDKYSVDFRQELVSSVLVPYAKVKSKEASIKLYDQIAALDKNSETGKLLIESREEMIGTLE